MTKSVFNLVTGIVGGVSAIASAIVTFFQPSYAPAIVACIGIVDTAVIEGCSLFVKNEETK